MMTGQMLAIQNPNDEPPEAKPQGFTKNEFISVVSAIVKFIEQADKSV